MLPPIERIDVEQGSDGWSQWRGTVGGASYAAAVLGISPYFPHNPQELFDVMTGNEEVYVHNAMRRGNEYEPAARAAFERHVRADYHPACYQRGRLAASLDGISRDMGVQIKIPARGRDSDLWKSAAAGIVPDHIMAQMQQEALVAGLVSHALWVYDAITRDGVAVFIGPDQHWQECILSAWDEYWAHYDNFERPPYPDLRTDAEWLNAARSYRAAKEAAKAAADYEAYARDELLRLIGDAPSVRGGGVRAVRVESQGSVDYKALLRDRLPDVDDIALEAYRKPGRISYRLTEEDE